MNHARLAPLVIVLSLACSKAPEHDANPPATTSEERSAPPAATPEPASEPPASIPGSTSGTVLGETWSFVIVDGQAQLHLRGRVVPLERHNDCFVTDQLHGCWPGPAEIAESLLRYHPDFSPAAVGE